MAKFKKGDIICGDNNQHGITNTNMTKGEVIEAPGNGTIDVKILEHNTHPSEVERIYTKLGEGCFKLYEEKSEESFEVGQLVVPRKEMCPHYDITGAPGTVLKVEKVFNDGKVFLRVVDHKDKRRMGYTNIVYAKYFKLQKPVLPDELSVNPNAEAKVTVAQKEGRPNLKQEVFGNGTFITVEDRYTIFIPTTEDLIGVSIKHPTDENNDEVGKALAMYRSIYKHSQKTK
ncbi:hypothetical protein [Paenibacillus chitinolyticus]|uniref:hypothetical protein n=1 Tax=Paenibacillus chitinolyticus TaxID=79263 RepID=UPI003D08553F